MVIRTAPKPRVELTDEMKHRADTVQERQKAIVDRALARPEVREMLARRPGRPPSGKVRVTMLLKPETIERFKATGKGWQARMSDALDAAAL